MTPDELRVMPEEDLSFEQLKAKRQLEWNEKMMTRTANLKALATQFANSPDVMSRPDPSVPWSPAIPGMQCYICAGMDFWVSRWVTVNGVKTRWAGHCTGCQTPLTWDWEQGCWLSPKGYPIRGESWVVNSNPSRK